MESWDAILLLLTRPDNIPVYLMAGALLTFTVLSFRDGSRPQQALGQGSDPDRS